MSRLTDDVVYSILLLHESLKYWGSSFPGGGGGTLIFSYIRRLGSSFRVQNFEFQYFWGYEDLMDIFWGSSENWTIFRGHFYVF